MNEPKGLASILQALAAGGEPNGHIAQLPSPLAVRPQSPLSLLRATRSPVQSPIIDALGIL